MNRSFADDDRSVPDVSLPAIDLAIRLDAGAEPLFDAVAESFLQQSYRDLERMIQPLSLLEAKNLGGRVPWLFRLLFHTRGYVRTRAGGEVTVADRYVIALRFLPDYLHHANRFEMLRLIEPFDPPPFHPNIADGADAPEGAVCVEVYAGESLIEICLSLHDLIRGRLRQTDERDALNKPACGWWRDHVAGPLDERPLFGQKPFDIELTPLEDDR